MVDLLQKIANDPKSHPWLGVQGLELWQSRRALLMQKSDPSQWLFARDQTKRGNELDTIEQLTSAYQLLSILSGRVPV